MPLFLPSLPSFTSVFSLPDVKEGREGRTEGRKKGRNEGRKEARTGGRTEGRTEGWKDGRMNGRRMDEKKKEGRTEGTSIRSFISVKKMLSLLHISFLTQPKCANSFASNPLLIQSLNWKEGRKEVSFIFLSSFCSSFLLFIFLPAFLPSFFPPLPSSSSRCVPLVN